MLLAGDCAVVSQRRKHRDTVKIDGHCQQPVPTRSADQNGPSMPDLRVQLGETKERGAHDGAHMQIDEWVYYCTAARNPL